LLTFPIIIIYSKLINIVTPKLILWILLASDVLSTYFS